MGDASPQASRGIRDYDEYLEVIDEIEKMDIIKTPRYRMCCYSLLDFLKAVCYYFKNIKKSK